MGKKWGCAVAAVALATGAHASNLDRGRAKMMALTVADIRSKITVEDDDLETVAVISTSKVYRTKSQDFSNSDSALRAAIDKKTGATVYQLRGGIMYFGGWRYYQRVNFSTPGDPVSLAADVLSREVLSCGSGLCAFNEAVGAAIPEEMLRAIATTTVPWRIRFSASAGPDWNEEMNPAEVAALLDAVTAYKAAHGLQ